MQSGDNAYQLSQQGKKNKTWLIIVIVLLVLCCCCVATALIFYYWLGDLILEQIENYLISIKLFLI